MAVNRSRGFTAISGSSLIQAFLLVLVSALNPAAVVASALYLGKERGSRLENGLLLGGLLMSVVVGLVVLVVVRATGLELPKHTTPRYDVRLGLGILALVLAIALPWLSTHLRRGAKGTEKPSTTTRLMEDTRIGGAIVAGALVFAPTVQYLAGLQAITTAERNVPAAIGLILAAAVINVSVAWIFLAAYLRAPQRTQAHLAKANTWITWVKSHRNPILRIVLAAVGLFLVITGAHGLAST